MDALSLSALMAAAQAKVLPPEGAMPTVEVVLRWLHFLAGITWIGLLYFFNLVNVPLMKELDGPTKGKVIPALMPRALWWFRWGAVVTVLAGLLYWIIIISADARNARTAGHADAGMGMVLATFFGIWTVAWAIGAGMILNNKGALNKGPFLAVFIAALVFGASLIFLQLNSHGWESSRQLSIGLGGGMGWMMLLNVWGIIWRHQKKIIAWTKANAEGGTPVPPESAALARQAFLASRTNAWLSLPMLFLMASASHYTFLVQ
ncbi:MAG: urate hydroxylase PuuD [Acidobacteria bacterium]|nr:urate hydroxylase PuuD [Acidobacteriota bacterium]